MNQTQALRLRRYLRTGGWDLLARNLPQYLREHGLPCSRSFAGHAFVFQLEPAAVVGEPGRLLTCSVQVNGARRIIASDRACYRPKNCIDLGPRRDNKVLSFTMEAELSDSLTRHSMGTGLSKGEVIRRALRALFTVAS